MSSPSSSMGSMLDRTKQILKNLLGSPPERNSILNVDEDSSSPPPPPISRKRRKLDKLANSDSDNSSSKSDKERKTSEPISPNKTCKRKASTSTKNKKSPRHNIRSKRSRKSFMCTPPSSGSEFQPSDGSQSDSTDSGSKSSDGVVESVGGESSDGSWANKSRKAKVISNESSKGSGNGSGSDISEKMIQRRSKKKARVEIESDEKSEEEEEEESSENSPLEKTPRRSKRKTSSKTKSLDRSRVMDDIESYSGNMVKQPNSKFHKYETSYYRDTEFHVIDEYAIPGDTFIVTSSSDSGGERKKRQKKSCVNVLSDESDEDEEEIVILSVSGKEKISKPVTTPRRSSRGIVNPTSRLSKSLESLKESKKSGISKVRRRLISELSGDEESELSGDEESELSDQQMEKTPVKLYPRQEEGFRDFIGFAISSQSKTNQTSKRDTEENEKGEKSSKLSGKRAFIFDFTQEDDEKMQGDEEEEEEEGEEEEEIVTEKVGRKSYIFEDSQEENEVDIQLNVGDEELSVQANGVCSEEKEGKEIIEEKEEKEIIEKKDNKEENKDEKDDKEKEKDGVDKEKHEDDPVLLCLRMGTEDELDALKFDVDKYPNLLHSAAALGNVDKFEHLLMYYGYDVWRRDEKRWLPLTHAVSNNHAGLVETLLSYMNEKLTRTIDELCKRCCDKLVRGDISCLKVVTHFDETPGTESYLDLIMNSPRGQRIMLQTIGRELNIEALNFVILQEVHLSKMEHAKLLVFEALSSDRWSEESGEKTRGEVFLETVLKHQNTSVLLEERDEDDFTPLMRASSEGRIEAVRLFLTKGADIEASDSEGTRCLHLAAMGGHTEALRALISSHHVIHCVDSMGWSPLMYAVFEEQWETVDQLMGLNLSKHSSVLLQSLLSMINRHYKPKEQEIKQKNYQMVMELITYIAHKDEYREQLNSFFERCTQDLINAKAFTPLFEMPGLISLKVKKRWLISQLSHQYHQTYSRTVEIRRDTLVQDLYASIGTSKCTIRSVTWIGEGGIGPGPLREFFSSVGPELCKAKYFVPNDEGNLMLPYRVYTLQRCHKSHSISDTIKIYEMIGAMIARSVIQNKVITLPLPDYIFNYMLGKPRNILKDFQAVDKQTYTVIKNTEDFASLEIPFVINIPDVVNGGTIEAPLKPGGLEDTNTITHKNRYLVLLARSKLYDLCRQELSALRTGFASLFHQKLCRFLSGRELSLLVCGEADIDINDWRAHTTYSGYTSDCEAICQFWRIVTSMSMEDRLALLHFSTGNSAVPIGGFNALTSARFNISSDGRMDSLPRAATCSNTLMLPLYSKEEIMKEKLLIAIRFGSCGFSFG